MNNINSNNNGQNAKEKYGRIQLLYVYFYPLLIFPSRNADLSNLFLSIWFDIETDHQHRFVVVWFEQSWCVRLLSTHRNSASHSINMNVNHRPSLLVGFYLFIIFFMYQLFWLF